MEVGDGLGQRVEREVGQLALEAAESLARQLGRAWGDALLRCGTFDEDVDAPVVALRGTVVELALAGRHKPQHLAVHIGLAGGKQLVADVLRHLLDVTLQPIHILEDVVVDALEEIGFLAGMDGPYDIRVVDVADFQRLRLRYLVGDGEMLDEIFHVRSLYLLSVNDILPQILCGDTSECLSFGTGCQVVMYEVGRFCGAD